MIKDQEILIKFITVLFSNAKIYLYGSRANRTNKPESDVDIAIDDSRKIQILEMARARNLDIMQLIIKMLFLKNFKS